MKHCNFCDEDLKCGCFRCAKKYEEFVDSIVRVPEGYEHDYRTKRLNIGCGNKQMENTINLDAQKLKGVDVAWNLEKVPLPFDDEEFDEIYAYHVLEHIQNFFPLMDELWRILKPKGSLYIKVPHALSVLGMTHPDHKRHFTLGSWIFFNPNFRENYYCKARFKAKINKFNIIREKIGIPPDVINVILEKII